MEQNSKIKVTLAAFAAFLGIAIAPVASAGDGSVKPNDARNEKAVKLAPPDSKAVKLAPADSKSVKLNPGEADAVKLDPAAQKVAPAGK